MAASLEELILKLRSANNAYTPLTRDEMARQAQNRYQSVYDQNRLNARTEYENGDAALARELRGLQAAYDAERAQSRQGYRQAYAQADRQALSRGMQRSSYNNATLANISLAGEQAQRAIDGRQTAQESDIGEKRTLLSQQLARQLSQYDKSQNSDMLHYIDELEAREYDRAAASGARRDELEMKLYEYQHQLDKEAAEQARWQAEYNAKYGGASTSRRGGGTKKSGKKDTLSGVAAALASVGAVMGVRR